MSSDTATAEADVNRTDYAVYCTSPILKYTFNDDPILFRELVDEIVEDLEFSYDYGLDSFPTKPEDENIDQKRSREIMVQEWIKSRSWKARSEKQAMSLLTTLFYSIWNHKYARQETTARHEKLVKTKKRAWEEYLSEDGYKEEITRKPATDNGHQQRWSDAKLGRIDPRAILQRMLPKVVELHGPRSGSFLATQGDCSSQLASYLRQNIWDVCKKADIKREDPVSIGGSLESKAAGVYKHILCDPEDAVTYYLYVGQSTDLEYRMHKHDDAWYRVRNPSFHYHVWDSKPGMKLVFVLLASAEGICQLQLNLLEMWCCLIFQTLPKTELCKFLPKESLLSRTHLNIASPLWQSFTENDQDRYERQERFKALIASCDPSIADYYRSLAQAFRDLKSSPNPLLRAYYMAAYRRCQAGSSAAKSQRTFAALLGGTEKEVWLGSNHRQEVNFGYVRFRILKQYIRLRPGAKVHAQGFLADGPNPLRYALDALPEDPAMRFSLRITGQDALDQPFSIFAHATGDITVKDINTLVERMEGVTVDEIAKRPRRMVPSDVAKGRDRRTQT